LELGFVVKGLGFRSASDRKSDPPSPHPAGAELIFAAPEPWADDMPTVI